MRIGIAVETTLQVKTVTGPGYLIRQRIDLQQNRLFMGSHQLPQQPASVPRSTKRSIYCKMFHVNISGKYPVREEADQPFLLILEVQVVILLPERPLLLRRGTLLKKRETGLVKGGKLRITAIFCPGDPDLLHN